MARIRTIKPEFFTSEDIVELTSFARLLYISIWCEADREGRLTWRPKTLKLRYFPADSIDIDALCEELIGRGLVKLYGDGLAYIPSFLDHQHINPRESASTLPDPHASARVNHASARDSDAQVGRERKGNIDHASLRVAFDQFWAAYPKKVGKGDAEKAWAKIKPDADLLAQILKAVSVASRSADWTKEEGKFIPHPSTWLNGKRWEDSITVLASVGGAVDPRFKGAK